jgi:hypothetical protein
VLVLRQDSDIDSVLATAEQYDHVWLIRVRELTRAIENALAKSLGQSRERTEVLQQVEHYERSTTA